MQNRVISVIIFFAAIFAFLVSSVRAQVPTLPPAQDEFDTCSYQEPGKAKATTLCPANMDCITQEQRYGKTITKNFGVCRKRGEHSPKGYSQICYKALIQMRTTPLIFDKCSSNQICDIANEYHRKDPNNIFTVENFRIGRCVPQNTCGKYEENCTGGGLILSQQGSCCSGMLQCESTSTCNRSVCVAEGATCNSGDPFPKQCCSPETACIGGTCMAIDEAQITIPPIPPTATQAPSPIPTSSFEKCYYKQAGIEVLPRKTCTDPNEECIIQTQRYGSEPTKEFGACEKIGTATQKDIGQLCFRQSFSGLVTGYEDPGPVTALDPCRGDDQICDIVAEVHNDGNGNNKNLNVGRCAAKNSTCGLGESDCKYDALNPLSSCCEGQGLTCDIRIGGSGINGKCVRWNGVGGCIDEGGSCGQLQQAGLDCCKPELTCSNNKCVKTVGSGGLAGGSSPYCGHANATEGSNARKCCIVNPPVPTFANLTSGCTDGVVCTAVKSMASIFDWVTGVDIIAGTLNKFSAMIRNPKQCYEGRPDSSDGECKCVNDDDPSLLCQQYLDIGVDDEEAKLCDKCYSEDPKGVWTAMGCIRSDLAGFITYNLLGWGVSMAGLIAFGCILYCAFIIQTSSGDPEKLKKAQERLTSCIVGLLIVIFSIFILRVIGVDILRIPGFGGPSSGGGGSPSPTPIPYACPNPDLSITSCDAFCKKKSSDFPQLYPKGGKCSFNLITPDGDGQDCPNTKDYQEIGSDDTNDGCNYRRICTQGPKLGQCCCRK